MIQGLLVFSFPKRKKKYNVNKKRVNQKKEYIIYAIFKENAFQGDNLRLSFGFGCKKSDLAFKF